jgi:hypothetical protein
MPRIAIEPQFTVEYLSIPDADGRLDEALAPQLAPSDLKRLHRAMLLGRRLDDRMLRLQRQGRILRRSRKTPWVCSSEMIHQRPSTWPRSARKV